MDVGIRELKARLSKYVERADRGETIRVTSRGRLRALLVAPGPDDPLEDPIGRGMREGWITPAAAGVGWARGWSGCRAPAAAKSSSARIVASEPVRRLQRPASSATSMSRTARRSPPSSPVTATWSRCGSPSSRLVVPSPECSAAATWRGSKPASPVTRPGSADARRTAARGLRARPDSSHPRHRGQAPGGRCPRQSLARSGRLTPERTPGSPPYSPG